MGFPDRAQIGAKVGSSWGTAVTVDRFWDYLPPDTIQPVVQDFESQGMRAGYRVRRKGGIARVVRRHEGTVPMEWLSAGMGWWLRFMLGATATGAQGGDGQYAHTGTIGSLVGDFFTFQANRPFVATDADQAFTWDSCKIPSWEMSLDRDGLLLFTPTIAARDVATATSLASASYTSGTVEPYGGANVTLTVGGSSFCAEAFTLSCNNGLKLDTHKLCSSGKPTEFIEADPREITLSLSGGDFDSLTPAWNRLIASAPSTVAVVITLTANTAIGGTTYPTTVITLDEGLVTAAPINAGPQRSVQDVTFAGRYDGSNSPLQIVYTSADAVA